MWQRNDLENFKKRLKALEQSSSRWYILTEEQITARRLRKKKRPMEKLKQNIQDTWVAKIAIMWVISKLQTFNQVSTLFDEQKVSLLRILTDRGTEYCGRPENHAYQLYLGVEILITEPKLVLHKLMAYEGSTELCKMNATILSSERKFTLFAEFSQM
ncbi:ISSod13 transposase [Nephila pilipes]|uniref:ISSod13 transposase n=1 Tax=Nephila pilipes TaxID=299642 RepID=A0A8X6PRB9_NEPPI|nr:ISSod13 transposase [Nephila pilipes]